LGVKKVLLDTNGYCGLLAGDRAILATIAKADLVYMSIFVLRELHLGFKGGSREQQNLKMLESFLAKPTCQVLNATEETVRIFGELKNSLKQAGTPLPINDVWIAAHTIESGSILISYDRHFEKITGLHHRHSETVSEADQSKQGQVHRLL
jgi:tRNA(fMet)-specific endonuclease VapC